MHFLKIAPTPAMALPTSLPLSSVAESSLTENLGLHFEKVRKYSKNTMKQVTCVNV